eukprot:GHVT01020997.1.p2 GENE.GHVT01020997.1~~GHVT01020997.1.p2  ORF type:complete len:338 (+),score=24.08 GHVT01020997.1:2654-3667(+)
MPTTAPDSHEFFLARRKLQALGEHFWGESEDEKQVPVQDIKVAGIPVPKSNCLNASAKHPPSKSNFPDVLSKQYEVAPQNGRTGVFSSSANFADPLTRPVSLETIKGKNDAVKKSGKVWKTKQDATPPSTSPSNRISLNRDSEHKRGDGVKRQDSLPKVDPPRIFKISKKKFLSGHITELWSNNPQQKDEGNPSRASVDDQRKEDRHIFNATVRDIRKVVFPHMDKFEQKQYEATRLKALGMKLDKRRKMPFNELMQRRKASARMVEKQKQTETELGIKCFAKFNVADVTANRKRQDQVKTDRKKKSRVFGFGKMGREANGVLNISKAAFSRPRRVN